MGFCLMPRRFYMSGCVVMFATSLPGPLHHGAGIGGLVSAMILIGLGLGGVKATISPFIGRVGRSIFEIHG